MLHVDALRAGYGGGSALHAVTLTVPAGTVHAVVGPNGAGKTTLLHTIAGLVRPTAGRIRLDNSDVTGRPAHRIARAGVALVPQGRRVFASLTVAEHLTLVRARQARATPTWTAQQVLDLLPGLHRRLTHRGAHLSGGEQQMLAIARALLTQPRLLLLDEPTEGLAPPLVQRIHHEIIPGLAAHGVTVLLATPDPELARAAADQVTILSAGRVTARFDPSSLPPDGGQPLTAPAPHPLTGQLTGQGPAAAVADSNGHPDTSTIASPSRRQEGPQ